MNHSGSKIKQFELVDFLMKKSTPSWTILMGKFKSVDFWEKNKNALDKAQ